MLVVEDAVDAAVGVVETGGPAGRAAARATALAALNGAAGYAAVVLAFDPGDTVAAFRALAFTINGPVEDRGDGQRRWFVVKVAHSSDDTRSVHARVPLVFRGDVLKATRSILNRPTLDVQTWLQ